MKLNNILEDTDARFDENTPFRNQTKSISERTDSANEYNR